MASPRKQVTDLRSGHIKADSAATAIKIIARAGDFRIYNTGENEFTVNRTSPTSAIAVRKKTSVDVRVVQDLSISGAASQAVRGIYEDLAAPTPIRHGRYKGPANATDGVTLASGRIDNVFYRILNAAKPNGNNFKILINGTPLTTGTDDFTLEPRMSIDVIARDTLAIKRGSGPVTCIYETLDVNKAVPSGRFSIPLTAANRHKIIDLTTTSEVPRYRIFNSGEEALSLWIGFGATTAATTLQSEQSFDFELNGPKDVFVSASSGTAAKLIEGIYEYLGSR